MEKRIQERTATSMPAHLFSDRVNVDCEILDLSASGARLRVRPGLFLPKHFTLRAPELGGDKAVEVMWRNKVQLGVRF